MAAEPRPCTRMSLLAAEADDVPDDEEIAGEIEFFDQRQVRARSGAGALLQIVIGGGRSVLSRALPRCAGAGTNHGFAFRDRVAREFVAQVVEREFQARGKFHGVGDGLGQVGEEPRHFCGDFRWRSELRASRRPASSSVLWWRMQVKTSQSARSWGVA